MSVAQQLAEKVRDFQHRTGEESMLVITADDNFTVNGIHLIGFHPSLGLLVDGRPPTVLWHQHAQHFHPLQEAPRVLH